MSTFAFVLMLQAAALSVVDDPIQSTIDVLEYEFAVSLPEEGATIVATARIHARIRAAETIRLDLDDAMTVVSIALGPADLPPNRWRHIDDVLEIALGRPHRGTVELFIEYTGVPTDGLRIGPNVYGRRVAFADNWPERARYWLPTIDHPSDKARVSWHIAIPAGWRAIANGTLERVDTTRYSGGRTVWHWSEDRPIPVHTMVIGAGEFTISPIESRPDLRHELWTFSEDAAYAVNRPFRRVGAMMRVFEEFLGPFPYSKLVHVETTTRFGAMENSSAIFYNQHSYAGRRLSEGTVAHELAHQWFGDAVSQRDWHHLWLSEGFATYLSALYYDLIREYATFRQRMAGTRDGYLESVSVGIAVLDTTPKDPSDLLGALSNQKGALVLHMLRKEIGDSAFRETLRQYYAEYRDTTALSGDFALVASGVAGRDLAWFFEQWLLQPGHPQLDVDWVAADDGHVSIAVRQRQPVEHGLYRMTLPVELRLADGTITRHVIEVRAQHETSQRLPVSGVPTLLAVDPDRDLLAEITVRNRGRP